MTTGRLTAAVIPLFVIACAGPEVARDLPSVSSAPPAAPTAPSVAAAPPPTLPAQAACADPLLTVLPVALDGFESITPLGNFNAPDHTIPTDHIYVIFRPKPGSRGGLGSTLSAPVVSPGRLKVESITRVTAVEDGVTRSDDFKLDFRLCAPVRLYLDHVNEIAPLIAAAIAGQTGDRQESHPRPTATYRYCRFRVDLTLGSGEPVGTGGAGNAVGIDIGATDDRSPAGAVAEPSRYSQADLHVICPLDLFAPAVREQLYARLGRPGAPRTVEPRCGTIYQDKLGTLQGNWFSGPGNANRPEMWGKSLALAHDNFDPAQGAIVIGGVLGSPGRFGFAPKHEGRVDREFSEVTDGGLYCYELPQPGPQFGAPAPLPITERLLVSLTAPKELKVERQSSSCGSGTALAFARPTSYTR